MSCRRPSRPGCRTFPLPRSRRSAEAGGLAAVWRRRGPLACLLFPVFADLPSARRRATGLYRIWDAASRASAGTGVVVGNITVGGTGKTPLVIHLALALRAGGRHPGIVSRGYGGTQAVMSRGHRRQRSQGSGRRTFAARPRASCPVFVGRDRVAAARSLLASIRNAI
jgi:tetraacyldisaccharide 4'-kinase